MNTPWLSSYDGNVPHHIKYPEITLQEILDHVATRFPSKKAVIWNNYSYSYAQIKRYSDLFAVALLQMGLQKENRVAVVLPNSPHFIICYYGILKAGGVVVAINPAYKEQEINHIISNSHINIIIADTQNVLFSNFDPKTKSYMVVRVNVHNGSLEGDSLWNLNISETEQINLRVSVLPDDPAVFQYSGGTTGIPKAAIGLHRNLVANSYQFRNWLQILEDGNEVIMAAIPLFHVYGMVIAMAMGMMIGATIVIPVNPRDMKEILQLMIDQHVTVFPGVPNQFYSLCQLPEIKNQAVDLSFVKACISGSAPLNPNIKAMFEKLTGAKIFEGYGLSEAPTATHCNPIMGMNIPGSVGLPLPDVNCKIVSLENRDVELNAGDIGELVIQGPQVMAGYYNAPYETTNVLVNGWLYTGDIARFDKNGYFYILDRKKDLIKVGGLQVWPREVEEAILTHTLVSEVGVAGVRTKYGGEIVKAWVVLKAQAILNEEEIIDWCKGRLAYYKCPSAVRFVNHLPRSSVGKLLRKDLAGSESENSDRS